MKKLKIGFIGLGMMGKYMAKNLLKNKYQVIGYNRSKKVLHELKKSGLQIATSPKDVAQQSDIVILMLPSAKETSQTIFGKNGLAQGLKKGEIIVDMSTSNPAETSKMMIRLKKKGIQMLEAPVSRGQGAAVKGTLSIMVGGDKKTYQKCIPIFKAMGEYIVYLGPFGSAMYVKALNNFLYAMNLLASSQGLVVLKKNKVDIKKAIEVISESSGQNQALSTSIKRRLGHKKPSINFYLRHMAKDMKIFNDILTNQKVKHSLAKPVLNNIKNLDKRHKNKDSMFIYEYFVLNNKK